MSTQCVDQDGLVFMAVVGWFLPSGLLCYACYSMSTTLPRVVGSCGYVLARLARTQNENQSTVRPAERLYLLLRRTLESW
jgi:hypothetical protein